MVRDFRPSAHEQWSERNQTLRHAGEKRPRDDQALLHNPYDYSGVGGPDDERVYGRTRSDDGNYPWNPNGGPYDRDMPPSYAAARRLPQAVDATLEAVGYARAFTIVCSR